MRGRMKKRAREGDDIYDPGSLLNTSQILILRAILYFYFHSLLLREQRHRGVKLLAQSHTASKRSVQHLF